MAADQFLMASGPCISPPGANHCFTETRLACNLVRLSVSKWKATFRTNAASFSLNPPLSDSGSLKIRSANNGKTVTISGRREQMRIPMKPKTILLNSLGVLCLIGAAFIGSLPFVISFFCGLFLLSRKLVSYWIAFCLIAAITVLSAAYPDAFHFGILRLRLHGSVTIGGSITFFPSLIWNLIMAHTGVRAGDAMLKGFRDARPSPSACPQ